MNKRIQELDAFRGMAALGVAIHHLTFATYKGSLLALGNTGVDLFFMISGYVIFLTINNTLTWKDFVISRFARLYPNYWIALLFTIILALVFQPSRLSAYNIFWNITMFQSLGNATQLDPSYWTLGVELTFYFFILLIYICGQIKRIEVWGALFMVFLLLLHVVLPIVWWKIYNSFTHRIEFLNHAPLFFIGILFYIIQHNKDNFHRYILVGLAFLLQTMLHYKGYTWYDISKTQHIIMMSIYILLFYLFIHGKMRWVVTPITLYFGKISYSLYLLHNYLGNVILIPAFLSIQVPFLVSLFLTLLICILLATLLNHYIEIPTNKSIRSWYKVRKLTNQIVS